MAEMIDIDLPNGSVASFPVGTPEKDIIAAIQKSLNAEAAIATEQEKTVATNTLVDDFSGMERFAFEFNTSPNLTGNIALLAEAAIPMGYFGDPSNEGNGFYTSPSEAYGEDYDDLSYDEKRQRIQEYRQKVYQAKYPELYQRARIDGESTGGMGLFGAVVKGIADPSTLSPVGKGLKQVAAISGLLAGGYEATRGLAEDGEIDYAMTGLATTGGAAFGTMADKAIRAIKPNYNRLKTALNARRTEADTLAANEKMVEINSKIIEMRAEGLDLDNPVIGAVSRLGIEPKEAIKVLGTATETFDLPTPEIANAIKEFQHTLDVAAVPQGWVADMLGSVSTGIKKISPKLYKSMQEFELRTLTRNATYMKNIQGFEKIEKAIPANQKDAYATLLANGDYDGAIELASNYGINEVRIGGILTGKSRSVLDIMDGVKRTLKDIHESRLTIDKNAREIPDYFPRINKDVEKTRLDLGLSNIENSRLDKMFKDKANSMNREVSDLTQAQKTSVMEAFLKNDVRYSIKETTPNQYKRREIAVLDSDLIKNYESPTNALTKYITRMTNDTETKRLFNNVSALKSNEGEMNISESIGALANDLFDSGDINSAEVKQLQKFLSARLEAGTQPVGKLGRVLNDLKAVSNMILLGNPFSAATQLGDLFVAAHRYGIKNTLSSVVKGVTGRGDINVEKLGLTNIIAEDMNNPSSLAGVLDGVLKYSGFKAMDRLGKNTALEAAFKMNKNLAKTTAGVAKLKDKWGDVFGAEFNGLVQDLSRGRVSENVKLLMFSELSGHQPISLLEMPLAYLQNPNGRIFYNLKSFAIKQLDMLRNSIGTEYDKGNYKEAGKILLSYATLVGGGSVAVEEFKNAIKGRGVDAERIPDNAIKFALGTLLTSRYTVENKLLRGDIIGTVQDVVLPPTTALSNATRDIYSTLDSLYNGEPVDPKALRSLPIAGQGLYNFLGGGAEAFLEKEERERYRD